MANSTVTITAVDNELYIIAYKDFASYQLAHIQTSYDPKVNVVVTIAAATDASQYVEPGTLVGSAESPDSPVIANYTVYIPDGTYHIVGVGLNWGEQSRFSFTINDVAAPAINEDNNPRGTVWNSGAAATTNSITVG